MPLSVVYVGSGITFSVQNLQREFLHLSKWKTLVTLSKVLWSRFLLSDKDLNKFGGCLLAVMICGTFIWPDITAGILASSLQKFLMRWEGSTKLGLWSITSVIFSL